MTSYERWRTRNEAFSHVDIELKMIHEKSAKYKRPGIIRSRRAIQDIVDVDTMMYTKGEEKG